MHLHSYLLQLGLANAPIEALADTSEEEIAAECSLKQIIPSLV